jgi:predicted nucleic acid-binding Zn ribbon protein
MPRGPQPMGTILAELMARNGFARVQSTVTLEVAWQGAAGALVAPHTRVGGIRRGKLEITVASFTLAQELTFQKSTLLEVLRKSVPEETIRDVRFRVGPIQ